MKIKKSNLVATAAFAFISFLAACQNNYVQESADVVDDCSAIFENRDPRTNQKVAKVEKEGETAENQPITQCKILEVKIDDDTKCQVVGSNKINNLKDSLAKSSKDKLVLIVPEKKFRDTIKLADNFLASSGINIEKSFNSEAFNSIEFPYKGLKCVTDKKKFVLWSGNKQVIVTLQNN